MFVFSNVDKYVYKSMRHIVCVCVYVYMYTHIVCVYVYMYIHKMCVYVYMYIHMMYIGACMYALNVTEFVEQKSEVPVSPPFV